jgi:hypothetical protein
VADVKFVTAVLPDVSRGIQGKSFEIERGVTVEGWAMFTALGYRDFEFESAFLSR